MRTLLITMITILIDYDIDYIMVDITVNIIDDH